MEWIKLKPRDLFKPVDAYAINLFRIGFGLILLHNVYYYYQVDFVDTLILVPRVLFPFDFVSFLGILPAPLMHCLLPLMAVGAIAIIFNKFTRWGAALYLLCYGYLFLLERSYYNNHMYLFLLLLFFFIFYKPVKDPTTGRSYLPYWFQLILRFQLFLVYFIGGVVKLNSDWLVHEQPLRELLHRLVLSTPGTSSLLSGKFALDYLNYGGVIYDLGIGFLLWNKRTVWVAILFTLVFNLTNNFIFNYNLGGEIGSFPLFMVIANLLFLDGAGLRKMLSRLRISPGNTDRKKSRKDKPGGASVQSAGLPSWSYKAYMPWLLWIYMGLQLLLPFRHFLYSGYVDWTGKASTFAWRMKSSSKRSNLVFKVKDVDGYQTYRVNPNLFINNVQVDYMSYSPDMMITFARFLEKESLEKYHFTHVEVFAVDNVSLNGRMPQPLVDSTLNLLTLQHHIIAQDNWILPLAKEYRAAPVQQADQVQSR